ncbi:hypothetical protein BGW80DRAFT_60336 [Lactifluus volemus]|nr:hypothetical protein BGW80DRAFT_60336 [Lactifluus volemus]
MRLHRSKRAKITFDMILKCKLFTTLCRVSGCGAWCLHQSINQNCIVDACQGEASHLYSPQLDLTFGDSVGLGRTGLRGITVWGRGRQDRSTGGRVRQRGFSWVRVGPYRTVTVTLIARAICVGWKSGKTAGGQAWWHGSAGERARWHRTTWRLVGWRLTVLARGGRMHVTDGTSLSAVVTGIDG